MGSGPVGRGWPGLAGRSFRMIPPRMSRPAKVFLSAALLAVAALSTACGTQTISVPKSQPTLYQGAVLFNQRCSGCHTLSFAATHGSGANVRTNQINTGPNFDIRCERPVARVLYAIENGGFSGEIMPQNIVVGQQAREVAQFVATYSGRKAPKIPGVVACEQVPIGTIEDALAPTTTPTPTTSAGTVTGTTTPVVPRHSTKHRAAHSNTLTITSRTVTGLGTILVNSHGQTLYVFAPDNASKVTCTGGCAAVWPPEYLPTAGAAVGAGGVKTSMLSSLPAQNGGKVVTYAGWPLYTYVADTTPGSVAGQAVNLNGGYWYVITTSGTVVKTKP
jgi:predicted lipoprotein with Yx(FWY)xxD motif/mono/diheme cytochrome c family protein